MKISKKNIGLGDRVQVFGLFFLWSDSKFITLSSRYYQFMPSPQTSKISPLLKEIYTQLNNYYTNTMFTAGLTLQQGKMNCFLFLRASRGYSSTASISLTKPVMPPKIRWFYATDIPNTKPHHPTYKLSKRPSKFLPFTREDSERLEDSYRKLLKEAKRETSKNRFVNVNEDGLFSADLILKIIKPTYWLGPTYEIRRGIWFLGENLPLPDLLSEQIEENYKKYRPDHFLGKELEGVEQHQIPPIQLKSEKEVYENILINGKKRKWPFQEFDDLSDAPKILHFKSDNLALLVNKGQLLPQFLLENLTGYSNSIFGLYTVTRGYEEKLNPANERQNKEGKSSADIDKNSEANKKINKMQELADEEKVAEEEQDGEESGGESGSGFLSETNKKFQSFMENDFSNESLVTENSQSREMEHLILCVHGIGQHLSSKYASVNFAHDCNHLRQLLKTEFVKKSHQFAPLAYGEEKKDGDPKFKNCKTQILPIVWRYNIDFGLNYLYNEYGKDGEYRLPKLSHLNIDAVTPLRNLTADVLLDVLLFYEPKFKKEILECVTESANDIYEKYLANHPDFKGKVSLIGHSLGSAILLDILTRQPDEIPTGKKFNRKAHLKFDVENFFSLGSPNGVFKFLEGKNVYPRSFREKNKKTNDAQTSSENIETAVYPKVNNLYNVFYATDLVAYRIEPLIHTSMSKVKPKNIKSINEENIITSKIKDISKSSPEILSNKVVRTIVENTVTWQDSLSTTDLFSGKESIIETSDLARDLLFGLNKNGRVDYVLPQGMFDIDMISAAYSHIQYFDDVDVADMILNQLWRKPPKDKNIIGVPVTIPKQAKHEQV